MIIRRLHELKGSLLVSNQFVKLWIIICIYLLQYVSATVIHKPTSPMSNISYRNYPPSPSKLVNNYYYYYEFKL